MQWVTRPEQCLQELRISTAVDVLKSENPSLVRISKELGTNGELACKAILTLLLNEMLDFFNVGKSMDQKQVAATVNLMVEDYSILKPDDFKLCFKRAMKGHYGKVYDRIDGELVFEWLEQFLFEKESEIEAFRRNENIALKKGNSKSLLESPAVPMPDYIKDLAVKKDPVPIARVLNQTDEQKQINGWICEFDQLWAKQGKKDGKRFVKIDDRRMDVGEYLEYKLTL